MKRILMTLIALTTISALNAAQPAKTATVPKKQVPDWYGPIDISRTLCDDVCSLKGNNSPECKVCWSNVMKNVIN